MVGPESEKWGWLNRQLPMLIEKVYVQQAACRSIDGLCSSSEGRGGQDLNLVDLGVNMGCRLILG